MYRKQTCLPDDAKTPFGIRHRGVIVEAAATKLKNNNQKSRLALTSITHLFSDWVPNVG